MAGKVLCHVTMSLDGFIAGPGDSTDRVFSYSGLMPAGAAELIKATGAILAGRRVHHMGVSQPWRQAVWLGMERAGVPAYSPSARAGA